MAPETQPSNRLGQKPGLATARFADDAEDALAPSVGEREHLADAP